MNSIKSIKPGYWDYSDSLLLYMKSEVDHYEILQDTEDLYYKLITKPEKDYLSTIAKDIAQKLPDNFEYIDLGPGTEHKEQFLFDELTKQGKKFTYIPVDINTHYLKLAEKHASEQRINVRAIQSSFEELSDKLDKTGIPRFVSLGLTFLNYDPEEILDLLKRITGSNGYIFINSQTRDRINMIELKKPYVRDALHMADEKCKLIGLDSRLDISDRETTDDIKTWTTIINTSPELKSKGVKDGDKLLLFRSIRYTKEEFLEQLEKTDCEYSIFDTGSPFISALIFT